MATATTRAAARPITATIRLPDRGTAPVARRRSNATRGVPTPRAAASRIPSTPPRAVGSAVRGTPRPPGAVRLRLSDGTAAPTAAWAAGRGWVLGGAGDSPALIGTPPSAVGRVSLGRWQANRLPHLR